MLVKVGDGVFVVVGEEDDATVAVNDAVEFIVDETAVADCCEQPESISETDTRKPSIRRVPSFLIVFLSLSWCLGGLVVEIASILWVIIWDSSQIPINNQIRMCVIEDYHHSHNFPFPARIYVL